MHIGLAESHAFLQRCDTESGHSQLREEHGRGHRSVTICVGLDHCQQFAARGNALSNLSQIMSEGGQIDRSDGRGERSWRRIAMRRNRSGVEERSNLQNLLLLFLEDLIHLLHVLVGQFLDFRFGFSQLILGKLGVLL
jgi:hypothetical protein